MLSILGPFMISAVITACCRKRRHCSVSINSHVERKHLVPWQTGTGFPRGSGPLQLWDWTPGNGAAVKASCGARGTQTRPRVLFLTFHSVLSTVFRSALHMPRFLAHSFQGLTCFCLISLYARSCYRYSIPHCFLMWVLGIPILRLTLV